MKTLKLHLLYWLCVIALAAMGCKKDTFPHAKFRVNQLVQPKVLGKNDTRTPPYKITVVHNPVSDLFTYDCTDKNGLILYTYEQDLKEWR